MNSLLKKLQLIQSNLHAPKGQFNSFGKYNYRNCEDILEALKPLLAENACTLTICDELVLIGERYYVKAIATIYDCETGEKIDNAAYAREEETKKGMDGSQITGASSSYARKYSLNGLFGIDDTKDSDTTNKPEGKKESSSAPQEYNCTDCNKPFTDGAVDKNGKKWSAEMAYRESQGRSPDNKARCKECREKFITEQMKEAANE